MSNHANTKVRTTAQHIQPGDRLLSVDGTAFGTGMLVEGTIVHDPYGTGTNLVGISVWGSTWMFGIETEVETEVVILPGNDRELPPPVDRSDQFRVHGTWYRKDDPAAPQWTGKRNYPV